MSARAHPEISPITQKLVVLGAKKSRALCDAIWNLEKLADARRLRPLLRA